MTELLIYPGATERMFLDDQSLNAGAANVSITPPVGIATAGYGTRQGMSERVVDPLGARALMLSASGRRVGLVICDLVSLDVQTLRRVRERAAEVTESPPDHLLLA